MATKYEELKQYTVSEFKNTDALLEGERKDKAIVEFETTAYPDRKQEAWKYTSLASLLSVRFQLPKKTEVTKEVVEENAIPELDADMLVFVNGRLREEFSHLEYDKFVISGMAEAKQNYPNVFEKYFNKAGIKNDSVFTKQNTAFAGDGAFIYITKNKTHKKPIHILHIANEEEASTLVQSRNLIVAEENSQVRIVETHYTIGGNKENSMAAFNNTVTELFLQANAYVDYNRLQQEKDNSSQINNLRVKQMANSTFNCNTITLSGKLVRNEIYVDLIGEHAETNLMGLYLPNDTSHVDSLTYINHAVPNCNSNQIYKGILDDKATAVFNGMVYVARDAQKTDAYQSNKNILLSDDAKVNSRPQLEIYADDVKCSHGSTTGQLNKDALFYLQARGIGKEEARALLLYAFASDVVNKIKLKPFRNFLSALLEKHFLD